MDTNTKQQELDALMKERLSQLPGVVQKAVATADIDKHLRELADGHKLHLDQWQSLENEVMLALLGFQQPEDLAKNIRSQLGVSQEVAAELAADISKIVFEPIREELERELEHPDAKAAETSGVEAARTQILSSGDLPAPAALPTVLPATPPAAPRTGTIERAPISAAYKAGEASTARKSVEDDPYREPPA
ncbi:hypothetical protein A3D71_03320 [Candidatus Kaiserbacteria bacterium RIFCSPHIGHO2_02_FULL_55_20]|uniref:Uncharacterized protein n=1 Tax=Candidatus Kaiserbacteria bacterium RIFCSPHIGHO2_02_FULL_55_20 TaxID=1798497 RepID=A0A1F6DYI2_9BACT|nr:MAG: hypothetical protein A2680_02265 [Candidatus Kaiserbacteria bacterium RIFCSPHIGHO2_01_FULL_55_37]OGG66062.1 MAG: hypothetical protein A3D71_03320 [Candidatus Kaiserbacteria bacterium RIFCSPHIGHO2_02_FULL_55_20]